MPKVSVIIPSYNSAASIGEAIDSVLGQTYQDYEIILVDDGSTDSTKEIASKYESVITYIHQSNQGPSAARNTGIRASKGEYLAFLDADDLFLPRKLELQDDYLNRNTGVAVVYSDGYLTKGETSRKNFVLFSSSGLLDKSLGVPLKSILLLAFKNAFPIHAAMARRECILDVGGFDESLPALEDWDLWFRVAGKYSFGFLEEVVALYRMSKVGITSNRQRQVLAFDSLIKKIEQSEIFSMIPNHTQAELFYQWGMRALEEGKVKIAKQRFEQAVQAHPQHIHPKIAQYITGIFGAYTIHFYHLKRSIIGIRHYGKTGTS